VGATSFVLGTVLLKTIRGAAGGAFAIPLLHIRDSWEE